MALSIEESPRLVLVTGGRDFNDAEMVHRALSSVTRKLGRGWTLIHGGARGADLLCRRWAFYNGIRSVAVPADWGANGKRAGPIRNAKMVSMGPVLGVVFPGGKGTLDCQSKMERAGIEIILATKVGGDDGTID